MGGSSFHRSKGQVAAPDHGRQNARRGPARRRSDVRRLLHRGLEGHQRKRHDPEAGSRAGLCRSLQRRADADRILRHRGALHRRMVCPRPAHHRQARRSVPAVDRRGRHRLCRPGSRILHVRRCPLRGRLCRFGLHARRYRAADQFRPRIRSGQHGSPSARQGRLFPRRAGGQRGRYPWRDGFDHDRNGPALRQAPPRSRRGAARAGPHLFDPGRNRRQHADLQVCRAPGRPCLWQVGHLHAQADQGR